MKRLWALVIALTLASPIGMAAEGQDVLSNLAVYPSLILYNARIYTMDKSLSSHQAMALRANRIWKLGTTDEIRKLAGPQTEMVDAKGRAVVPGLIDAHTQPQIWGVLHLGYKYDPQLQWLYVEGKNLPELKSRFGELVAGRIRQAGSDKWIIASISRELASQALAGGITETDLDSMAPDTPLAMMTGLVGGAVTNSKAKQEIVRQLGKPLLNASLIDSVRLWNLLPYDIVMKGKTEKSADLIAEEMQEMVPLGITTVRAQLESPQSIRALNYLDQRNRMPLRMAWVHQVGFSMAENPSEYYSLIGDIAGQGSPFFWNNGVGDAAWDNNICTSVPPKTKQMQAQIQREMASGRCQSMPGTRLYEAHLAAARNGLRLGDLHLHSDLGFSGASQLAETVLREKVLTLDQLRDQKWGFLHGHFFPPDKIPQFAKYGFWMSFQARSISREDRYVQNFGAEYASWVSPARAFLDAGAHFTLNTGSHLTLGPSQEEKMQDRMLGRALWESWPDEWRNTVWPWLGVWVTREINGKVFGPERKLDRTTVMKAWTLWPAEFLMRPDDLGSLEAGKLGDFLVIDKDYFTIPESEINSIQTLMTVIDGKVRYKSPKF